MYTTNILKNKVNIYPSSNASDGGELNTENNLKNLSNKFYFKSYALMNKMYEDKKPLSVSASGSSVVVQSGRCFISGYYMQVDNGPEGFTITPQGLTDSTEYCIVIQTYFDATGYISGDIGEYCDGVKFNIIEKSSLDESKPYLILGTVVSIGGVVTVVDSKDKYFMINADQIGSDENGKSFDDRVKEILNSLLEDLLDLSVNTLTVKYKNGGVDPAVHLVSRGGSEYDILPKDNELEISFGSNKIAINRATGEITATYNGRNLQICSTISKFQGLEPSVVSGSTVPGFVRIFKEENSNVNGTSDKLARADHLHNQYIQNQSLNDSSTTQSVSTNMNFNENVSMKKNLTGQNGVISGFSKVYNAVWNDYADAVLGEEGKEFTPGDVISKVPGKDCYTLSNNLNSSLVVGVYSDTYGHLLGGRESLSLEESLEGYIPIAVSGNVRVKIEKGLIIKEGQLLRPSKREEGRASVANLTDFGKIIGKALESSDGSKDRILMQVMLS